MTLVCLEEKGTTEPRAKGSGFNPDPGICPVTVNPELVGLWTDGIIPDTKECGDDLNSAEDLLTLSSETFGYGENCLLALAVPLAYCPDGYYPVARAEMTTKEGSGFPGTGTTGRETGVLIPEILLATTVVELERAQGAGAMKSGITEGSGSLLEGVASDNSSVRAVKFLTPSVEQWKPTSGDPYKAHRWSPEKRDLDQMMDESWKNICVSEPLVIRIRDCMRVGGV